MYDAVVISKLIINYCISINKPIQNIKLVKLIFFIQYHCWVYYNELFFKNDFSKNNHGGYIDDVWREYRIHITKDLPKQETYKSIYYDNKEMKIKIADKKVKDIKINYRDWDYIKIIIDKYIDYDVWDLVEISLKILKDCDYGNIDWNKIKIKEI